MSTHLSNISVRQKKSFVRDVVFAAVVALASVVSVASVGTAVNASAHVTHLAQR